MMSHLCTTNDVTSLCRYWSQQSLDLVWCGGALSASPYKEVDDGVVIKPLKLASFLTDWWRSGMALVRLVLLTQLMFSSKHELALARLLRPMTG